MERGAKPIPMQRFAVGSGQCADKRGVGRSDREGHTSCTRSQEIQGGGGKTGNRKRRTGNCCRPVGDAGAQSTVRKSVSRGEDYNGEVSLLMAGFSSRAVGSKFGRSRDWGSGVEGN